MDENLGNPGGENNGCNKSIVTLEAAANGFNMLILNAGTNGGVGVAYNIYM